MVEGQGDDVSHARVLATVNDPDRSPVADPGLDPHLPRWTDVDRRAAARATRQVATMFCLVPLLAIGFVLTYFLVPRDAAIHLGFLYTNAQHLGMGLSLGFAVLLIGVGAVQWARQVMVDQEMTGQRHDLASPPTDRAEMVQELRTGVAESKVDRRKILGFSLLGALGALVLPVLALFADLGPWPTKKVRAATIETTIWSEGVRLVSDVTYLPIKASSLVLGQLVNAEPENMKELHGTELLQARAKAAIIIVRMDPNSIRIPESRRDWQVGGILCYSKICTHVGCPISLWEHQTHHLLCPCHQSTFDLGDAGKVIFGPAARSLPQLPITTDSDGYLVARSGFTVPVGPSYFERNSPQYYERREG
jgi:ubiquinol-cytochrome c reductase iron-sulfur subunit